MTSLSNEEKKRNWGLGKKTRKEDTENDLHTLGIKIPKPTLLKALEVKVRSVTILVWGEIKSQEEVYLSASSEKKLTLGKEAD